MGNYEVCYKGNTITRKSAKSLGLKRYFTEKPCKHNHISERYVNSGKCCQCNIISTKDWRENKNYDTGSCTKYFYKELPSLDYLKKNLSYDPETGIIKWNKRPLEDFGKVRVGKVWNTRYTGKEAGAKHYSNGYIEIRLPDKLLYKAHRIAWKMYHGEDPKSLIDHINGVTNDNRIVNLREATHQQNSQNSKATGISGYKGVVYYNSQYTVSYCVGDVSYFERGFSSGEEAALRYDEIVKELYGEYANLNFPEEVL